MMGGYVKKGHILLFLYAFNHHIVPFHVAIKIKRSLECNVWCLFYGKDLYKVCLLFFYLTRNDLNQKMWQTNRV